MKLTEENLRRIVREEIADVEPYDNVLAKVSDEEGRSAEIKRKSGRLQLLLYAKGRLRGRVNLGREEASELADALS